MGRLARWRRSLRIARDEWLSRFVPLNVGWVKRATAISATSDDLVVVCLVRNSEARVSAFLDYYLKLGAQHIVLVDNGSTDRTVEKACQSDDRVSILNCRLDYRAYQIPIKMWLTTGFGREGWCLVADIDEYFDYPESRQIDLGSFLSYLNANGFSGVVCQSIDLFSDRPLVEWPESGEDLRSQCVWYDHSMLTRPGALRSFTLNRVSSPEIKPCKGGIKKVAFDVDRLLTKHVLIRPSTGTRLNGAHHSRGAHIADLSAALLHYPFDRGFRARCEEAVRGGQYWQNSLEFRVMLRVVESRGPRWMLKQPTASRLQSVDQLVDEGFLVVSDTYRQYVRGRTRPAV